ANPRRMRRAARRGVMPKLSARKCICCSSCCFNTQRVFGFSIYSPLNLFIILKGAVVFQCEKAAEAGREHSRKITACRERKKTADFCGYTCGSSVKCLFSL